jgi:exodeoxyribonuclease-3
VILATWNVNSIRMRLPRFLDWLERRRPDVVCLQETKVEDPDFPIAEVEARGYHAVLNGQRAYNGVAILSRSGATDVVRALDQVDDPQRRLLAATVDGLRVVNIYAPNGGEVGSDKYAYKLAWYRRLDAFLAGHASPEAPVVLCGDLNVAPADLDVWDPAQWRDQTMCTEPERDAFRRLQAWGLHDALRLRHPETGGLFTWWDYRAGAFHRGWGLRIDHVLVTASLAARAASVEIDRPERKGPKPSDHAPVLLILDLPAVPVGSARAGAS